MLIVNCVKRATAQHLSGLQFDAQSNCACSDSKAENSKEVLISGAFQYTVPDEPRKCCQYVRFATQ